MSQTRSNQRAILVLGMHRTGTSLTMAAVEALGVESGSNLLPPGPDNETGYWEDRAILDLNERLLAALGKSWYSVAPIEGGDWERSGVDELEREAVVLLRHQFGNAALWGFKDPRSLRLLPFWQRVLSKLGIATKYVVTFRNPGSVAASLAYRDHFSRARSYYLWLSYYLPFLDRLQNDNCLFLDYDRLIDDPQPILRSLEQFIHGAGQESCSTHRERVDAFLEGTLRKGLRHTRLEANHLDADAPAILRDTFSLLENLAARNTVYEVNRDIEALQRRYRKDALLLYQIDVSDAQARELRKVVVEEEPIRDKIQKMGLYQADIHNKIERIDACYAEQVRLGADLAGRVEDIQEKLVVQVDEAQRRAAMQAEALVVLDARVEDIQERVTVQIDELHRIIDGMLDPGHAGRIRISDVPSDLGEARAQLEIIHRSISWRITKPVRATGRLARKLLRGFGR